MKYILFLLVFVSLLTGCASALRSEGEPYSGYSCRESLMHFNSFCTDTKLTNEEFEAKFRNAKKILRLKSVKRSKSIYCGAWDERIRGYTHQAGKHLFGRISLAMEANRMAVIAPHSWEH